jgi:hypothetical protein
MQQNAVRVDQDRHKRLYKEEEQHRGDATIAAADGGGV